VRADRHPGATLSSKSLMTFKKLDTSGVFAATGIMAGEVLCVDARGQAAVNAGRLTLDNSYAQL